MELQTEPEYDPERLRTDYAYRFEMADHFAEHMKGIEESNARIGYFLKMTKAMGLPLTMGNPTLTPKPAFTEDGDEFFDEDGNDVPVKVWQPFYTNEREERGIITRAYFLETYRNSRRKFCGVAVTPLAQRIAQPRNNYDLEHVTYQIDEAQMKVNQWIAQRVAKKDYLFLPDSDNKQYYDAAKLIEWEIKGSTAVDWSAILLPQQLEPFAAIWNMVEFKVFLETKTDKGIKEQTEGLTFADLFINPDDVDKCVEALRLYRIEKPILGDGLNWTGSQKDKGIIVAWIERMETMRQPKIKRLNDRKRLVELLNQYFNGLNMGKDARVFANVVSKKVKDQFTLLIQD